MSRDRLAAMRAQQAAQRMPSRGDQRQDGYEDGHGLSSQAERYGRQG